MSSSLRLVKLLLVEFEHDLVFELISTCILTQSSSTIKTWPGSIEFTKSSVMQIKINMKIQFLYS